MEFWPFCDDNRFIFGFTSYPSPITHVCELDSCSLFSFIDRVIRSTQNDRCTERKKNTDLLKNTDNSVLLKVESSTPYNEQESSSQT
jgi:hypothetical protein